MEATAHSLEGARPVSYTHLDVYKRQTLTLTAALGVNDDQIGPVIQLALQTPFVGGVTIQPVFGSGRSAGIDPVDRLTHTGVLARLGEQTDGQITWRDLTALPCSHPHCASVGYFLRDDSGQWRSLVSVSYTHLDVYKRQFQPWGICSASFLRCRPTTRSSASG